MLPIYSLKKRSDLEQDTYRTASRPSTGQLYKEKGSKFYSYVFPVENESEVKIYLADLKKQHYGARHWCYAYQIGTSPKYYRANDDGEPSNSAGMPIYGQIQAYDLTNILVVVVRYFGGIKLGVGGLVAAYKIAAKMGIEETDIIEKTINLRYFIHYDYSDINKVMRIIKEHGAEIKSNSMESTPVIEVEIRKNLSPTFISAFENLHTIQLKPEQPDN
jgi:uncharacterized YigZ family protein